MASSSAHVAMQTFSLTNDVVDISPDDAIYKFDAAENRRILNAEPWRTEYAPISQ